MLSYSDTLKKTLLDIALSAIIDACVSVTWPNKTTASGRYS